MLSEKFNLFGFPTLKVLIYIRTYIEIGSCSSSAAILCDHFERKSGILGSPPDRALNMECVVRWAALNTGHPLKLDTLDL